MNYSDLPWIKKETGWHHTKRVLCKRWSQDEYVVFKQWISHSNLRSFLFFKRGKDRIWKDISLLYVYCLQRKWNIKRVRWLDFVFRENILCFHRHLDIFLRLNWSLFYIHLVVTEIFILLLQWVITWTLTFSMKTVLVISLTSKFRKHRVTLRINHFP